MRKKYLIPFIMLFSLLCGAANSDPDENRQANKCQNYTNAPECNELQEVDNSALKKSSTISVHSVPKNLQNGNYNGKYEKSEGLFHIEREVSIGDILMVFVNILLVYITWLLVKITRVQYFAANRPEIKIELFNHKYVGDNFSPTFWYVNIGATEAKVTNIDYNVFLSDGGDLDKNLIKKSFDISLAPGDRKSFQMVSNISARDLGIEVLKMARGQKTQTILCIGKIRYSDKRNIFRETGFCREYRESTTEPGQWVKVDNSDYEYSY